MRVLVWTSADPDCPPGQRCMAKVMLPNAKGALELMPVVTYGTDPEETRARCETFHREQIEAAELKRANYKAGAAKRAAAKAGVTTPPSTPAETPAPVDEIYDDEPII